MVLSLCLLLLAGAAWSGSVYCGKAARLSRSLESARMQYALLRGSLAVADSAAEKARARLARVDNVGFETFMHRVERLPLSNQADTVKVNPPSDIPGFSLQIASHRGREEAGSIAAALGQRLARRVEVAEVQVRDTVWYRVFIEPFPSQSARPGVRGQFDRRGSHPGVHRAGK